MEPREGVILGLWRYPGAVIATKRSYYQITWGSCGDKEEAEVYIQCLDLCKNR